MNSIRSVGLTRSLLSTPAGLSAANRSVSRAVVASASRAPAALQQSRMITNASKAPTTQVKFDQELKMLNEQRSVRPISPHFTIYQPQLTWLASIANRVTGAGLSVGECRFHLSRRSSQVRIQEGLYTALEGGDSWDCRAQGAGTLGRGSKTLASRGPAGVAQPSKFDLHPSMTDQFLR